MTHQEPPSPLIGRASELSALIALVERCARGGSGVALVEGEAGIGKTRLVGEAEAVASSRGVDVLHGKADALEQERPFSAIADALGLRPGAPEPAAARLGELLFGATTAERGTGSEPDVRFRVLEGIVELVERRTVRDRLLLVLDDLQWADGATLLCLHHLVRRLATLPLAIIGTLRSGQISDDLARVIGTVLEAGGAHVRLQPLDDESIVELVRQRVGHEPGPRLLGQVRGAAGNPFFVCELVDALAADDQLYDDGVMAEVVGPQTPVPVRLAVIRRLTDLGEPVLRALRAGALLGSSFSVHDVATVLGEQLTDVSDRLEAALRADVLADAGRRLVFRHDLVREAIVDDFPGPVRMAMHLEAARRLAAASAPAGQAAVQFALGASVGDREAVDWLRRAAVDAFSKDPRAAASFLDSALQLVPPPDPDRQAIQADLAQAWLWCGKLAEAEALAADTLSRPHDPRLAGGLRNALARALVWQGRSADSLAQVRAALQEPGLPDRERSQLLAQLAHRFQHCRDLPACHAAADEAIAFARRVHQPVAECDALCARCWALTLQGHLREAIAAGREALAITVHHPESALVDPWTYIAQPLVAADRIDEAAQAQAAAMQASEHLHTPYRPVVGTWLALQQFLTGRWDDALAEAEANLVLADDLGMRATALWNRAIVAQVALRRGDLVATAGALDAGWAEVATGNPSRLGLAWLLWTAALLDRGRGDTVAALALLAGTWELFAALDCLWECQELHTDLVRLAVDAGDRSLAERVCASSEKLSRRAGSPSAQAAALHCRGLLDDDAGRVREAAELYRSVSRLANVAAALEDAGSILADNDEGAAAVASLAEAVELHEQIGATADLGRVEARLRGLGVRRGARGRRGRPTTGWDALTPTELEIARLAAQGLTNPEIGVRLFVSRRTVGSHLSHIFTKLGLGSRVELAAELVRRRQLPGDAPESISGR